MSTAAPTPLPPPEASPSVRLVWVVRRLIEYGRELANTLRRQRAGSGLADIIRDFGTHDIGLIMGRITRGLQRANELEARVLRNAARLDAKPDLDASQPHSTAGAAPAGIASRVAASPRPAATPADPRITRLPTPEQIARDVRRRPIGAVVADICRDLGITPGHPLWRDLQMIIIRYGGNFAGLIAHILRQLFPVSAATHAPAPPSSPPPASTRPP